MSGPDGPEERQAELDEQSAAFAERNAQDERLADEWRDWQIDAALDRLFNGERP